MKAIVVRIPGAEITDTISFHAVMARVLGLPTFYGANLDALADCLHSVDAPADGMVDPAISPGELMLLQIDDAELLRRRCPREYDALIEVVAFVNQERARAGRPPVLGIAPVGD